MIKIKCEGCGRIVETDEDWDRSSTCKECGESFEEIDDEENEDDEYECRNCEGSFSNRDIIIFNDDCSKDEYNASICKECIDKFYPRESKVEYKEKIVEKPVYINTNQTYQSESKSLFKNIL